MIKQRNITLIVVHCTASRCTSNLTPEALDADVYKRQVVAFGVGSDMGDVAHVVYRSVFGDVVVVTTFGCLLYTSTSKWDFRYKDSLKTT